jgi:O-antigen ligase
VLLLTIIGAAAVPIGSIDPWWSGIFEAVIFLLGACALIATIGKSWSFHYVGAVRCVVLVACLQVIPLYVKAFPASYQILSLNPFETGRFAIRLGAVGLTLTLLLRFTKTQSQLLKLAQLVIFVGVASAVLAIWRRMLPDNTLASLWNSKDGDFGQFTNRNHFTLLMEMCLGPTLSLAFYSYGPRRFLYFDIALLLSLALILVNSRGGVISMIAQLAFMSWIYFSVTFASSLMEQTSTKFGCESRAQQFWRIAQGVTLRSLLILLLLGTVSAGVVWLGGESVRERLESVPGELVPRSGPLENVNPRRLEIWTATWKLIKAHPFMGSGIGAYKTAISQYLNSGGSWEPQQAHNEYLELTAVVESLVQRLVYGSSRF